MKDRIPSKPNRYAVYDDAHNFVRYEYHERADEPTQVGDALNKANLLPDDVATALGLTGNPQVKDALAKTKTLIDGNTTLANSKVKITTGSYVGTGTFGEGNENSITVPFVPRYIILLAQSTSSTKFFPINPQGTMRTIIDMDSVRTAYTSDAGFWSTAGTNSEDAMGKKSTDGKTFYWYTADYGYGSADAQFNKSGYTVKWLAIGGVL